MRNNILGVLGTFDLCKIFDKKSTSFREMASTFSLNTLHATTSVADSVRGGTSIIAKDLTTIANDSRESLTG